MSVWGRAAELHLRLLAAPPRPAQPTIDRDLLACPPSSGHLQREAAASGKGSFAWAWMLDERPEERARGVTVDVAVTRWAGRGPSGLLLRKGPSRAVLSSSVAVAPTPTPCPCCRAAPAAPAALAAPPPPPPLQV